MSLGYAVPRTERCVVPTSLCPATARDAHAASLCYFSYTAASPLSSPSIVQVVVQHNPLVVSLLHLALRPLNAPHLSCLIASPISLIVLRSPSHCPSLHLVAPSHHTDGTRTRRAWTDSHPSPVLLSCIPHPAVLLSSSSLLYPVAHCCTPPPSLPFPYAV